MRTEIRRGMLLLATAALIAALPGTGRGQEMSFSEAQLVRRLLPSVVNITARATVRATPEPAMASASGDADAASAPAQVRVNAGSGFIIDPSGEIATNWHVVVGAYEIVVTFSDGSHAPATLVNAAPLVDLAVIKVDVGHTLPAKLGRQHQGADRRSGAGDRQSARRRPVGQRRASSARSTATSWTRRTTTSSRPMPRSITATPAARCSTCKGGVIGVELRR